MAYSVSKPPRPAEVINCHNVVNPYPLPPQTMTSFMNRSLCVYEEMWRLSPRVHHSLIPLSFSYIVFTSVTNLNKNSFQIYVSSAAEHHCAFSPKISLRAKKLYINCCVHLRIILKAQYAFLETFVFSIFSPLLLFYFYFKLQIEFHLQGPSRVKLMLDKTIMQTFSFGVEQDV